MFSEEQESKEQELGGHEQREAVCQCTLTTSSHSPCISPVTPQSLCSKCKPIDPQNSLFSSSLDRTGTTVTSNACFKHQHINLLQPRLLRCEETEWVRKQFSPVSVAIYTHGMIANRKNNFIANLQANATLFLPLQIHLRHLSFLCSPVSFVAYLLLFPFFYIVYSSVKLQ